MTEDKDKYRKYVHGAANPQIDQIKSNMALMMVDRPQPIRTAKEHNSSKQYSQSFGLVC